MKFKSKLSAVTMSVALLVASFLSVVSHKNEVNAKGIKPTEVVETYERTDVKNTEGDNKKGSVDEKNSSEKVNLSEEEIMKIVKKVRSVGKSILSTLIFTSLSLLSYSAGFPFLSLLHGAAAVGTVIGTILSFFC